MTNNNLDDISSELSSNINMTDTIIKSSKNNFVMKNYFSYKELNDISDDNIIKIIESCHLITFISNIYLETQRSLGWLCCGKFEIKFNSCKDIIFLPYEFKFKLMDIIKSSNELFSIVFDGGMIKKGIIYRRIIVQKSYAFIPLDKYQYKLTEYNIRGFCQIVEELGATKIEIDFLHIIEKEKITNINSKMEIKKIAGDLGFSISNKDEEESSSTYILEYPDNNNLLLNINRIVSNLKGGKYLISYDDYRTNLELQYVINSRCKHFITNYSTNFKIKRNNDLNIDNILCLNLGELSINGDIKKSLNLCDNILIETKVNFNNNYRSPNQLLKYSISPDEIGFNFIFNNIKKKYDNLPREWLIFIWRFINIYCYENCKLDNNIIDNDSDEYNSKIYTIDFVSILSKLNNIKNNFSLKEISNILCNYFTVKSQMTDLKNFLDILDYKTKSYDELGFFLVVEKNKILKEREATQNILEFIIAKEKNNDKLKELLQVYNNDCINQIYIKLKNIGLLNFNNWNSLEYLLKLSKNYILKTNLDDDSFKEIYKRLYNNYKFGLHTYEFYENILPFIENLLYHFWYKQENLEIDDINIILRSISEESFKFNMITSLDKLKLYLKKKTDKYKEISELESEIKKLDSKNIEIIIKEYLKNNKNNKNFIIKKINLVYGSDYSKIKIRENEKKICCFFKRIICYNERLNIHSISLDKYGFLKVKNNLLSGNYNKLFDSLWKPFIFNYINFNYPEVYQPLGIKYEENKNYLYDDLKFNLDNYDIDNLLSKILEEIL